MEFAVLGRMWIRRDGVEIPLAGTLQRVLLGVLLARANAEVATPELADAM